MKISEISQKRLRELNSGRSETKNLTEWLAVDQKKLLLELSKESSCEELVLIKKKLPKLSVPKQISWIGIQISELEDYSFLKNHTSDIARCWACYADAFNSKNLRSAFQQMKVYASDKHFGIREVSWMAVRERICEKPLEALSLLTKWAHSKDENIRRFSTESTRPRGVWAKHIPVFKKDPQPAKDLLDLLYKDESRYVQDSVANWLNDAAKDNPDWVFQLTESWLKKSKSKETQYIVKRARRSIR